MARPQSTARLGFYPFPPAVMPNLLSHLAPPADPSTATLLDPCCGKGAALKDIADHLGVPPANVYGIELAGNRAEESRALNPGANILGPATFTGTRISYNGFSVVYTNPPFDAEEGGGRREELTFFVRSVSLARPGGLVVLVVPETSLLDSGYRCEALRLAVACRLGSAAVFRLPPEHREYREVVVLGYKNAELIPGGAGLFTKPYWEIKSQMPVLGDAPASYNVLPGRHPKLFEKTALTPEELKTRVAASPLNELLAPAKPAALPSPLLPLSQGHIALVLAAGNLDGLVWPDGEPPHVVRGTARKERFLDVPKCDETVNDDGSVTTKDVYSEKVVLSVRAVSVDGAIRTFTNNDGE